MFIIAIIHVIAENDQPIGRTGLKVTWNEGMNNGLYGRDKKRQTDLERNTKMLDIGYILFMRMFVEDLVVVMFGL